MKKGGVLKKFIIILAVIIILIALVLIWLYTGKPSQTKQRVLSALPLPIAMVGNKPLMMGDYSARYGASVSGKMDGASLATLKKNLLNTLLIEKRTALIAQQYGVSVNSREIDEEYARAAKNTDLQGKANFEEYLRSFGLSEQAFRQVFLKPQLLDTKLMVWFNNQKELNQESYGLARQVLDKINASTTLESLVRQYSQDSSSKSLEGDMGYVLVGDLLPELQEQVDAMPKGEMKMLVSRYGIHLTRMEDKDNQGPQSASRVHLRQIFIPANDYQKWLSAQGAEFPVRILYNPAN